MPGQEIKSAAPKVVPITEKNIVRDFEKTHGYLTVAQLPPIDFTERSQIELLFPEYRRHQIAAEKNNQKLTNSVDLVFNLKTPNNSHTLFSGASLEIEAHKRCALFGINGSGKTTLFQAIAAYEIAEFPKTIHVHHMKELEHNEQADSMSCLDTVMCAHPFRRVLICVEAHLKDLMEKEEDKDGERYKKLSDNLVYVEHNLRSVEAHTTEKRAKQMLRVLGFDDTGEKAPLSSLSGGLRMRVALACAFIIDPDLLLLDEPTNHLDMPSVLWLENKLRGYSGSYLLVTHDRTLLENVVTSVMLIQDLTIKYYACGFKEFEKRKEQDDEEREANIDKFLLKHRNISPDEPLYRTKMQYKEWLQVRHDRKIQLAGKFTFKPPKELETQFPDQPQEEVSLIKVEKVRFSYDVAKGLPWIFDAPISYEVKMNTRVGIMGPNGAGKSTFLKLITNKLQPVEGKISTHPNYTLAYFGQHSTKELKLEMTPLEFMIESFPEANVGEIKSHLTKTSIGSDPMNTRMKSLSFSQRSCVIFAKLTFVPPHLLIMDEPTNFLDLESVDSLITAVNKFSGGLITVTHNRDFLKRTSKTFLSILPGAFLEFATAKEAERATYSFMTALEEGNAVDFKSAIQDNRGGGSVHTEESLEAAAIRIAQQKLAAKKEAEAKAAAETKAAADKEAALKAKTADQKANWAVGETCWVGVAGKFEQGKVKRVIPGMGIIVELKSGKTSQYDAHKLKVRNPDGGAGAGAGAEEKGSKAAQPKQQPQQQNNNNNNKQSGQQQQQQPKQQQQNNGQQYKPVSANNQGGQRYQKKF